MAISVKQAAGAKPKDKVDYLNDGNNLRLRIRPNGTKDWVARYTLNRKQRDFRIGMLNLDPVSVDTFNPTIHDQEIWDAGKEECVMGPAQARKAHQEWVIKPVRLGVDPRSSKLVRAAEESGRQAEAQAEANAVIASGKPFRVVADEWLKDRQAGWSVKFYKASKGRVNLHMNNAFGDVPINMITRPMIIKLLKKFHGVDRKSAKLEARDKVHMQLKQIFEMAKLEDLINDNPAVFDRRAAGLQEAKAGSNLEAQSRKMLDEDPEIAWEMLPEFWNNLRPGTWASMSEVIAIQIKLIILTLSRPGEVRCGKWSEIDFDKAVWSIPKERMKQRRPHAIPLSDQVVILLRRLQEITGEYEHMFPKMKGGRNVVFDDSAPCSDAGARTAIRRMGYQADLHGFRHMASSKLHSEEFGEEGEERAMWDSLWIEYALSHVDKNKMRGKYNKANYLKARARMLQWYADQICPTQQLELVSKSA